MSVALFCSDRIPQVEKGERLSLIQGVNKERDDGDAGLEIPTDCLKQPSSTLVGLIWNGKWLPVQSTNGIYTMRRVSVPVNSRIMRF